MSQHDTHKTDLLAAFYILWDAQKHLLAARPYPQRVTLDDLAAISILSERERDLQHQLRGIVRQSA